MSQPQVGEANILWFLPTHGESRYLGTSIGARAVDLKYLRQVAQAADDLGYYGVLLPTGRSCEIPGSSPPLWRRSRSNLNF